MNIVAIIQARMGSSRLKGKVLMELEGKPVIGHIVERLLFSKKLNRIIVATSISPKDDVLYGFCMKNGIDVFRGQENDVLDRYYQAAKLYSADVIVRITGDCPVVDPDIVDELVDFYLSKEFDVCGLSGEFPDGLDCELFSFNCIKEACMSANLKSEREHVGTYFYNNSDKYKIGSYNKFKGLKHYRWTLDESKDFDFLTELYKRLYVKGKIFKTKEIIKLLNEEPELSKINNFIVRNEGYIKSLKEDKKDSKNFL